MLRRPMTPSSASLVLALATVTIAGTAQADDAVPEPSPPAVEPVPVPAPAAASPSMFAPTPPATPTAEAVPDHDARVGRLAIAYHGLRIVPGLALDGSSVAIDSQGSAKLMVTPDDSAVPLFGIRAWFSPRVGLDVSAGLGIERGSVTRVVPNPNPALDRTEESASARKTTLAARVSLPISLVAGRHHHLLVLPELDLGYSTALVPAFGNSTTGDPLDLRLTGFGFGAGARFAGELHFGFWGVPQLSLQAAFGLRVDVARRRGAIGVAEATHSDVAFGSTASSDPWRLLAGGFSLLYGL